MSDKPTGGAAGPGVNNPQVDRVIEFLQHCDNADIQAGIGALLGIGSAEAIRQFRAGIALAIADRGPGVIEIATT